MTKKSKPVVTKEKKQKALIIKGLELQSRDFIHFDHILHRSGTGAHKSQKTYSRKAKHQRDGVFFLSKCHRF